VAFKGSFQTPRLCHHKGTGRAYVRLNGKQVYLAKWGSAEAERRYFELCCTLREHGGQLPVEPERISVAEVVKLYFAHCRDYYGPESKHLASVRISLEPLVKLYGDAKGVDFGPRSLKALRQRWIDAGLARKTVNDRTGDVKRCFKWAASEELIPSAAFQALSTVDGLRRGRSAAKETEPVQPVPLEDVEAVRPFLPAPVRALVDLQLLTAARPGELLNLTPGDIDQTTDPWEARPVQHKGAWRGKGRIVLFGPRAQSILRPFLLREPDKPLFSPKEAEAERHSAATVHRRPNQRPNPRKTDRTLRDHYDPDSYRRAIERACDKAGVTRWTPYRLRHSAATAIRKQYGLEAAQVILGHAQADVTQIYAAVDREKAASVLREIG